MPLPAQTTYIPDTQFASVFKNISGHDLWISFIPLWGATVKAGVTFYVDGDPRIGQNPNDWPRKDKVLRSMIERGLVELISTPDAIVDNGLPDGRSSTLNVDGTTVEIVDTTVDAEAAESRNLPTIVPTAVYAADKEQFTVTWTNAGILPYDKFELKVTDPDAVDSIIKTGHDKMATVNAPLDSGDYTFTVTLIALDGRTAVGTGVTEPAEAPEP